MREIYAWALALVRFSLGLSHLDWQLVSFLGKDPDMHFKLCPFCCRLLFEPWMAPAKWESMGGQFCDACSNCRQSEWALAHYLGRQQTNSVFKKHWETWFTQEDVDAIVAAGMNTIRIPLGFWVIEDIVDTATEPYAQGGLDELVSQNLQGRGRGFALRKRMFWLDSGPQHAQGCRNLRHIRPSRSSRC